MPEESVSYSVQLAGTDAFKRMAFELCQAVVVEHTNRSLIPAARIGLEIPPYENFAASKILIAVVPGLSGQESQKVIGVVRLSTEMTDWGELVDNVTCLAVDPGCREQKVEGALLRKATEESQGRRIFVEVPTLNLIGLAAVATAGYRELDRYYKRDGSHIACFGFQPR
jgi:ribosomal protein S18 acetylase RimI-like enzyme